METNANLKLKKQIFLYRILSIELFRIIASDDTVTSAIFALFNSGLVKLQRLENE